jgi:outer membrane lipoprotein SlyB
MGCQSSAARNDHSMEYKMETPSKRLHPVIWVAAVAVTLFSVVGIGAVTGLIPVAGAGKTQEAALTQQAAAVPATSLAAGAPTVAPAVEAPRPVAAEPAAPLASEPAPAKPAVTHKAPAPKVVKHAPAPVARAEPATEPSYTQAAPVREYTPPPPPVCRDCGMIESVQEVQHRAEAGTGLGAVAGGLLGGVLGHQVGGGHGRDLATVVGAVAGGVAGNNMERNVNKTTRWDINVRFDDGSTRTITTQTPPTWRSGDRVKVINGVITGA